MAFAEDLSQFFDLGDFADKAEIILKSGATRRVSVIFNAATEVVQIYDQAVNDTQPTAMAKTADTAGVRRNDAFKIGGKTYSIERLADDGTGVSTIFLK